MMKARFSDAGLQQMIAHLAVYQRKGLQEVVRDIGKRFIRQVVRNTPPMIATQTPAAAKRAWETKITDDYTKTPYYKGKWRSKVNMRKIIQAKKKALGRLASGWMNAANELNAPAPSWVKKHGEGEGGCRAISGKSRYTLIISNAVPYATSILSIRTRFSLDKVKQGLAGNLRVLKQKMLRSVRRK